MYTHSNGRSLAEAFDLSSELKMARDKRKWTQMQLSMEAQVSTRTIVALESGKLAAPRPDVLVRLARALQADPKSWLKQTAGSRGDKALERSLRLVREFHFHGEMDPADYFSNMLSELADDGPRLMCVCYPSNPGTAHRPDVRNLFARALNRGLGVALVCPFTKPRPVESSTKPHLSRYYRDVYEHVILLARDLAERIDSRRKNHLAVFVPARAAVGEHWSMPPQGVSKVRQALIKRFDIEEEVGNLQLIAWVELIEDNKDRMIEIYPSEKKEPARLDVLRCWKEYFSDIIKAFDVKKGWASSQAGDWKMAYPQ